MAARKKEAAQDCFRTFNYFLLIQYNGRGFAGWQSQPHERTVQAVISRELQKLCGCKVILIGAGRTDAGAHAFEQVANFKTKKKLAPHIIKNALNANLLPEVYIKAVEKVSLDFHARYNAKKKMYRYLILRKPSPFLADYGYSYFGKLSVTQMRKAAKFLIGRHDFRSFCDGKNEANSNFLRTIDRITISNNLPPLFRARGNKVVSINVEGRSFLCHMVRIIAGTLLEAGRGKIAAEEIKKILELKDRRLAGRTLPAKGLFLMHVYY
jgi:tRNA pseudouridine38-40 synthase